MPPHQYYLTHFVGLFASISSELDAAGQDLLSELLIKNIETVVTVDSNRKSPSRGQETDQITGNSSSPEHQTHRGKVEIRLKR
jgi:hypothetical protein